MKTIILFLFFSGLVSAAPNGTIRGLPKMENCANMPSFMKSTTSRIIGGQDAPEPIPWQVALHLIPRNSRINCGATILDASTLLSAAHCFDYFSNKEDWFIRVGSVKDESGGQVRKMAEIIFNTDPEFEYDFPNNDFVIIKLDIPLNFDKDVKPACLPSSNYLDLNSKEEQCYTSGWGDLTNGDGQYPTTCQYVRVPVISNPTCSSAYGFKIPESMICAGYLGEGGKDSCGGDSGGPLVCNNGGKAIIAGVVSWGYDCADPDYPGVYSRTTHVLDWIKSQMEGTPPPPPSPPTTTTTTVSTTFSTSTSTTGGCGLPEWATDESCDDENNNAGCNWDDGACCGDNVDTEYCTNCECLEPNA